MEVSEKELIRVVEKNEPTSVAEIADILDVHPKQIHESLNELKEKGKIQKKQIGEEYVYYIE